MNNTNSLTTSLKTSKFTHAENSFWTRWSESSIYWFSDAADAESARADLTAQGWNVTVLNDGDKAQFPGFIFRVVASRPR